MVFARETGQVPRKSNQQPELGDFLLNLTLVSGFSF